MYNKHDSKMTQGVAILCMVILHLFCRQGADVFGTPLLWLNETTPFVYWFGFFAEICVPLYSLTIGYAQELLFEARKSTWKDRLKRILKLMENYWIVVVVFSIIGLIVGDKLMPGSIGDFMKALLLLHSYNGAWWFLRSYVLLLLIPPSVLLFPVHKSSNPIKGGVLCSAIIIGWYLLGHFNLLLSGHITHPTLSFLITEIEKLIGILPVVWFGGIICRFHLFDQIKIWLDKLVPDVRRQKIFFVALILLLFIGYNLIHKSVTCSFVAVIVFFVFNLWHKREVLCQIFRFLGKHSTNIWLTHMFFYIYVFPGLVQRAKYPVLMLGFILLLCIICSYLIMEIQRVISIARSYIISL